MKNVSHKIDRTITPADNRVWDRVGARVTARVWYPVWERVSASVCDHVWARVKDKNERESK